ncbi:MAG: hypothetical protein HYY49_13100 [Ignavibacteriales bacterium]|nr:hypothetical protein [Ignavibacteriales bacterium]
MAQRKREPQPLSPGKRRIFFAVMISLPFVFLVCLELFLRSIDYGPNLSLFIPQDIARKTYLTLNPDVKGRYFSRVQFTPNTSNDFFLPQKPEGTIRIFSLGGSTTVGFPYGFVGSFSTFLRERLQKLFPEKNIEIINLGMTATNSYTVNDIANELFEFQPDLLIVYDGHNEFYGALGISSVETLGGSRWMIKTYLQLVHLRLFHFIKNIIRSVVFSFSADSALLDAGTMMERLALGQYVPYGSPQYSLCLKNFERNLSELVEQCAKHKVPLVLGTQASNLRNRKPFVSNFDPEVTAENREKFLRFLSTADEHVRSGRFLQALSACDSAISIDSLRADAHFLKAQCLDTLRRKHEAKAHYIRATDFDQLRFRASTDFNKIIRDRANGKSVFVADVETAFAASSPDSIAGKELFLEHLHPRLYGNFLLARIYAETMKEGFLLGTSEEWERAHRLKDADLWMERSASELDERAAERRVEILTSSWPFASNAEPHKRFSRTDTIDSIIDEMVRATIGWEEAHVKAAELYAAKRELYKALAEYRAILSQLPLSVSAHLRSAQLYLMQKDFLKARHHLWKSMNLEKTFFASKQLGALAAQEGNMQEAAALFEEAKKLAENLQQRSEAGYLLAFSHVRMGHPREATAELEQVLAANPGYSPARDLLTRLRHELR